MTGKLGRVVIFTVIPAKAGMTEKSNHLIGNAAGRRGRFDPAQGLTYNCGVAPLLTILPAPEV